MFRGFLLFKFRSIALELPLAWGCRGSRTSYPQLRPQQMGTSADLRKTFSTETEENP
jgi:hypothetical protein